jgi:hypothetical protein
MQYYFRYVLDLKERPKLHMSNGTAGHRALELNALHKIETQQDQPLEQILDNFSDAFTKELNNFEPTDFAPDDNADATKDGTVQSLSIYRKLNAPLVQPLAVELAFTIPIATTEEFQEEAPPVQGHIDIIERQIASTRIELLDNKFPTRLPSSLQDLANLNDQLTVYDYAMNAIGQKPDELGFLHFVPPTKTLPSRIIKTLRANELLRPQARGRRYERLLYKIRTVTRGIRTGIFIPTDNPQTCRPCGYNQICQYSLAKNDYNVLQIRQARSTPSEQPTPRPEAKTNDSKAVPASLRKSTNDKR